MLRRNKAQLVVETDSLVYGWLRPLIFQAITAPLEPDERKGGRLRMVPTPEGDDAKRWLYVILVSQQRARLHVNCVLHAAVGMQSPVLPVLASAPPTRPRHSDGASLSLLRACRDPRADWSPTPLLHAPRCNAWTHGHADAHAAWVTS